MGILGLALFGGAAYYAGKKMNEHRNPDSIRGNINGWGCGGGWKRHHEEWKQFKEYLEQKRLQDQQPLNEKPTSTREMQSQPTSNVDGYGYAYNYPPEKVQPQPSDSQYVYHARTQGYWHPDKASVFQRPQSPTSKPKPNVQVRLLDDAPPDQHQAESKHEYNHPSMTRSMSVPPAYAGVNENGGRVSPQMGVFPGQYQYPQIQSEAEKDSGRVGYFWK